MGLFTLVDRISLLRDCRAIMKLMVKLQRCPKPDKAGLCLDVENRLQTLSSKGDKMPDAAMSLSYQFKVGIMIYTPSCK